MKAKEMKRLVCVADQAIRNGAVGLADSILSALERRTTKRRVSDCARKAIIDARCRLDWRLDRATSLQ